VEIGPTIGKKMVLLETIPTGKKKNKFTTHKWKVFLDKLLNIPLGQRLADKRWPPFAEVGEFHNLYFWHFFYFIWGWSSILFFSNGIKGFLTPHPF